MKIQKHFKYTSNTKSNWWQWMINDIYEIKKDYNNAVKIIEKECSELIDNYLTNNDLNETFFNYFIICDRKKVIPFQLMYDDMRIIYKSFLIYNEYYNELILFNSWGLQIIADNRFFKKELPIQYKEKVNKILKPDRYMSFKELCRYERKSKKQRQKEKIEKLKEFFVEELEEYTSKRQSVIADLLIKTATGKLIKNKGDINE